MRPVAGIDAPNAGRMLRDSLDAIVVGVRSCDMAMAQEQRVNYPVLTNAFISSEIDIIVSKNQSHYKNMVMHLA